MTHAPDNPVESSIVITQYETLRGSALGDALLPDARAGLLVFLRRGMRGWARTLTGVGASRPPTACRSATWKAPEENAAIIRIFAAMAIKAGHEGVTQ